MSDLTILPSVEQRLAALIEVSRRISQAETNSLNGLKPTITISREFGCEAFPVAEKLKQIMEKKTKEKWALVDKSLILEVAKRHDIEAELLKNLGKRPRLLDDMLSALSSRWTNEKDHFQILVQNLVSIASKGNAIIVGLGAGIVSQSLENCYHFRMFGSKEYRIASMARRKAMTKEEAEILIEKKQKERRKFIREFLGRDTHDPELYHMLFNCDRNNSEKIAKTIANYINL
jgi:cytidylate kinase